MRAFAPLVVLISLLAGCATQQRDADAPPPVVRDGGETHARPAPSDETLEQMLEHEDFDLPRALLLFSEEYYAEFAGVPHHEVDIPAKLARFEGYADQLRDALRSDRSPRQRVRTLVDFIHIKLGLRFDQSDSRGENYENLFFDSVLQRRFGYCVSLSMAYLVFGQAAGLDVRGIRLPGHFVVEFKDTEPNGQPYKTLLETTAFGETREETYYWARDRFSAPAVENGVYLTPLNDREIFSTLYNNLAGVTYVSGDLQLAVERYTRALELAPNNCEALYNRAIVQHALNHNREALKDLNESLRLDPTFVLAMLARAGLLWDANEREPAREDLAHAKRLRPEWPQTWMIEGMFLFESGDIDAARTAFETALEKDPKYNSAHIALAELEHKVGNEAAARKHEEAAGMR
ncbi:MAG: tetratricopeptide repeat protein [Planctomycetes bacterium]|nr:tetratricopeptide repeat protein [Planctomycetota bacterium]